MMSSQDILKDARKKAGMTQREFSAYFGIPYRTLQQWEQGKRQIPSYLLRLMLYKLGMDRILEKKRLEEMEKDISA